MKPKPPTTPVYWRVKLIVGIKTYMDGNTEEEAIQNAFEKFRRTPEIEEHIYSCKLIKGKATTPMSREDINGDSTNW